jgi:hypothetical protein
MKASLLAMVLSLLALSSEAHEGCDTFTLQQKFSMSHVVVFARVIESTFPSGALTKESTPQDFVAAWQGTATLRVVKSWKGWFAPGLLIRAGPPNFATSGPWSPRPVHVGDEILVFGLITDPLWLDACGWVVEGVEAQDQMKGLDSIVLREPPNQRLERP